MRVYQFAKEIGATSMMVMQWAEDCDVEVYSPLSELEAGDAEILRKRFLKIGPKAVKASVALAATRCRAKTEKVAAKATVENWIQTAALESARQRALAAHEGRPFVLPEPVAVSIPAAVETMTNAIAGQESYRLSTLTWDQYVEYWDGVLRQWYAMGGLSADEFTDELDAVVGDEKMGMMDKTEIPEPYYGNPQRAKMVVVCLHPGIATLAREGTNSQENDLLIQAFDHECNWRYSLFAEKFSPLTTSYRQNLRKELEQWRAWIKADLADVFVLTACPYHPFVWKGGLKWVRRHIIEKVISPAILAAKSTMTRTVLFVGREFNELIPLIEGVSKERQDDQGGDGDVVNTCYYYRSQDQKTVSLCVVDRKTVPVTQVFDVSTVDEVAQATDASMRYCTHMKKWQFRTLEQAMEQACRIFHQDGELKAIYKCSACGAYHIGSPEIQFV